LYSDGTKPDSISMDKNQRIVQMLISDGNSDPTISTSDSKRNGINQSNNRKNKET
jgi:hypothetical protein